MIAAICPKSPHPLSFLLDCCTDSHLSLPRSQGGGCRPVLVPARLNELIERNFLPLRYTQNCHYNETV